MSSTLLRHLRVAAATAHAIPEVSLVLTWGDGSRTIVSHDTDSAISPCELRHLVIGAHRFRVQPFIGDIQDVDLHDGLVHVGAGLYATACPFMSRTRWMATFLSPREVRDVIERCPVDHTTLTGRLVPDCELSVTLVCMETTDDEVHALETASVWVNTELLVSEATHMMAGVGGNGLGQ